MPSAGRAPSLPTIHPHPPGKGRRNMDAGLRSHGAIATSRPQHTPPPQHRERPREPEGHFYPGNMCFWQGGHPRCGLPSPISLQRLFLPPQGCAARASGPPHPQPWKCPSSPPRRAPMIHHFVAAHTGLFPFPAPPKTSERGNLVTAKAVAGTGRAGTGRGGTPGTHVL